MILSGGLLAGIGFTMALFIANLAYTPEQINAVKFGILLASVLSAFLGLVLLLYVTRSNDCEQQVSSPTQDKSVDTLPHNDHFNLVESEHEFKR